MSSIIQGKKLEQGQTYITYDMGEQKRSSSRRYDSSSGHVFIIGGINKDIIGVVLYFKVFCKCDAEENRGEEAEER